MCLLLSLLLFHHFLFNYDNFICMSILKSVVHTHTISLAISQDVVKEIIFPLLCQSDADEALFNDDPYEYVRLKFGKSRISFYLLRWMHACTLPVMCD